MESPKPYLRSLGGMGRHYLTDCLIPIAELVGKAEFSFCDVEGVLSQSYLPPRKMFSQMRTSGFIVKQHRKQKSEKINRYLLHPETFRLIKDGKNTSS
jgi:hypothetical protein